MPKIGMPKHDAGGVNVARHTRPLTNTEVKAARATDKPTVFYDGDGLELLVKPDSASKLWRFRYYKPTTKKRAMMSFGAYPAVSLADARRLKDETRALLAQGIDPQEHRQEQHAARTRIKASTFQQVTTNWFTLKTSQGLAENTLKDIWRSLEKNIFPTLGSRPVSSLTAHDFINTLNPLAAKGKGETLRRTAQRVNEVMYYAVNTGLIPTNPASHIHKAYAAPVVRHMPTIRPEELPEFMQALALARVDIQTRLIIEWQLLTICRPGDAAGTRWDEINLSAAEWTIPAGRLKQRREHIIPLNRQAITVLEAMHPVSGHREHVFPHSSDPTRPMCEQTANAAIKRMGYGGRLVAHGLRSIASTALNEEGFPPDVIEAALSHIDKNEVRRAYNRSTYLEQRRPLMAWWGNFVEQAATGSLSAANGLRGLKVV